MALIHNFDIYPGDPWSPVILYKADGVAVDLTGSSIVLEVEWPEGEYELSSQDGGIYKGAGEGHLGQELGEGEFQPVLLAGQTELLKPNRRTVYQCRVYDSLGTPRTILTGRFNVLGQGAVID